MIPVIAEEKSKITVVGEILYAAGCMLILIGLIKKREGES
jgi:hypothetical protein